MRTPLKLSSLSVLQCPVRQHRADEQDQRVEVDQPEMAEGGDPVVPMDVFSCCPEIFNDSIDLLRTY
jgi:hypothetical protein